jgi:hypothetical protein
MSDLSEAMEAASQIMATGQVDETVFGNLELPEIIEAVAGLVSDELMHLSGLGEDADANEQALRTVMQNAAFKAFMAGMLVRGSGPGDPITITVPTETLEAIGLAVIRDGYMSFTLVGDD